MEKNKKIEDIKLAYDQGFLSEEDFKKKSAVLTNNEDISAYKNNSAGVLLVVGGFLKNLVSMADSYYLLPIRKNVVTLHKEIGIDTDSSGDIPRNISAYKRIWDIRPGFGFALTEKEQTQYKEFLQHGGRLVLIGENASFVGRNNSIVNFVEMMGGGKLTLSGSIFGNGIFGVIASRIFGVNSTQTVKKPFLTPKPISWKKITYAAPGGVTSSGTGSFATKDIFGRGTAILWQKGTLSNAPLGTLIVVFDVNFLQNTYGLPNSQNFAENMIRYMTNS
ncbi:hypothetical protein BCS42_16535 [Crenothrix sp. D3]|nr:hypothetical protein BCS42_16535 [Crenothrix sp. D3]